MVSSRFLRSVFIALILLAPIAVRLTSGEHDSSASSPPVLSAVSMSGSITGGGTVTIKVSLSDKATAATAVALHSNRPSVLTPPATVTVPAGQKYASVQVPTRAANQIAIVTISAMLGSITKTTQVTVKPPALSSVSLPEWVAEGGRAYLTVRLNSVAPRGGMDVAVAASPSGKLSLMPSSVHVPGGTTGLAVALRAAQVPSTTSVTIQGTLNGITKSDSMVITDLAATATPTRTRTPSAPTATKTPGAPTATPTKTPAAPTATKTNIPVPPTATRTNTPVPPTATPIPQITGVDLVCSPSALHPGDYSTCTVTLLGTNLGALPPDPVPVLIGKQPVFIDAPDTLDLPSPSFTNQFQVRALATGTTSILVHAGDFFGGWEDTFYFTITNPAPQVTGITLDCPNNAHPLEAETCTVYIQGTNLHALQQRFLVVTIFTSGPVSAPGSVNVGDPFESETFVFTPSGTGTGSITVQLDGFSDTEDILVSN